MLSPRRPLRARRPCPVGLVSVLFGQETAYLLAPEPAVTALVDPICADLPVIAPPPQGVRMDMEEAGYFPAREHILHASCRSRIPLRLFLNQHVLRVTHLNKPHNHPKASILPGSRIGKKCYQGPDL